MKAPDFMHDWLAKLTRPFWKRYVDGGNSRKAKIKEMLEGKMAGTSAHLSFRAGHDGPRGDIRGVYPIKLGGMGRCYRCGEIVSNLALHEARCEQWTEFGEPVLKELAEADIESNITLPPGDVAQITDTGRGNRG